MSAPLFLVKQERSWDWLLHFSPQWIFGWRPDLFYYVEMIKTLLVSLILLAAPSRAVFEDPPKGKSARLVLNGLDPVLLTQGEEKLGREDLWSDHQGFRYRFAVARNKQAFEGDPKRFGVQIGGACPVRPDLEGKPEIFRVHQGRIYLFFTEHCRHQFQENPQAYLEKLPQ